MEGRKIISITILGILLSTTTIAVSFFSTYHFLAMKNRECIKSQILLCYLSVYRTIEILLFVKKVYVYYVCAAYLTIPTISSHAHEIIVNFIT